MPENASNNRHEKLSQIFTCDGEPLEHFPLDDRGFAYADGVFETMLWADRCIPFLDLHLERLLLSCERLGIKIYRKNVENILDNFCKMISFENAAIKLVVTRGIGGSGYRPPEHLVQSPMLVLSVRELEGRQLVQVPAIAKVCRSRLFKSKELAGMKHLAKLDYVLAANEILDTNIIPLMRSQRGELVEAIHHNLFFVKNGKLYTPELSTEGVKGIGRTLIYQLAKKNNISVEEIYFDDNEILIADAVFLTNSLSGITPIRKIFFENVEKSYSSEKNREVLLLGELLNDKFNAALKIVERKMSSSK